MSFVKKHKVLCTVLGILIVLLVVLGIWGYNVYQNVASSSFKVATGKQTQEPAAPKGAITSTLSYMSEVLMMNSSEVPVNSVTVGWDDAWFENTGKVYNHDLANFCIAACAMANGESLYYAGSTDHDLARETLIPLGFEDIDTVSYEEASKTSDEIDNVFDDTTDQVAYVMAHKTLQLSTGPQELVLIAVRGTYGTEWLSNFKVDFGDGYLPIDDHAGYAMAAANTLTDLQEYCWDNDIDPSKIKMLITGHSRGGSVAGSMAETAIWLTQISDDVFVPNAESLYTYCFATSPNTRSAEAHDEAYSGIFNIINPTDVVPMVPLAEWGFTCWGTIGSLPGPNDEGFTSAYKTMDAVRAYNTGYTCTKPYAQGDTNMAVELRDDIAEAMPSAEDISDAGAVANVLNTVTQYDVMRILSSHFPDTYMAWMQTISASDIAWQ